MTQPAASSDPLWDAMIAAARGEFALSTAVYDAEPHTERESRLVDAALAAGVLGALTILRSDPPPTRH